MDGPNKRDLSPDAGISFPFLLFFLFFFFFPFRFSNLILNSIVAVNYTHFKLNLNIGGFIIILFCISLFFLYGIFFPFLYPQIGKLVLNSQI